MMRSGPTRRSGVLAAALVLLALLGTAAAYADPATGLLHGSLPTSRISGSGSSWAGNAVDDWQKAVSAQGVTVDYNPAGSSRGRKEFAQGLADFAVSEIPYTGDTSDPQDNIQPNFRYGMLPVVAGGTAFMYNLKVGGTRYESLKLSQAALAKIFSGQVDRWDDPVIKATNPGVALPNQRITVVVRSDGSGATAQFTLWMLRQFPHDYAALCAKTRCNPHTATSYYPYQGLDNFTAQSSSANLTTYVTNTEYTISYDEYSYALGVGFPVAQIKNAAGFYTLPTDTGVAVALTQAVINGNKRSPNYLSQDLSAVYPYKDPRTYPISAYSYMIEPTQTRGNFDTSKGQTLAYFEQFLLCEGQQTMGRLGYSPLPMNLVLAALDQVLKVPGIGTDTKQQIISTKAGVTSGSGNPCNNPTFEPGESPSHNVLIDTAPFPDGCDTACQAPWIGRADNSGPGGTPPGNAGGPGATDGGTSGPGGSGPGSASSGPTTGADAPGTGGSAGQTCDPDTGLCTGDTTAAAGSGDATASATPYTLAGQPTWGTAQLALLISVLLVAALVLGPPLMANLLDTRPRSASSMPPVSGDPPPPAPPTPYAPPAPPAPPGPPEGRP